MDKNFSNVHANLHNILNRIMKVSSKTFTAGQTTYLYIKESILHNLMLPAEAASSWSVSIISSQATGIMSIRFSSDKMGAALAIIPMGHWVSF